MGVSQSQFAVIEVPCDYQAALRELIDTMEMFIPDFSPAVIRMVFERVELAFEGGLPGYQRLLVPYHNYCHTLEVAVCAARILHGLHLMGHEIDARICDAAICGALLHDTGYLKLADESDGSGAQFTAEHVQRSVVFARNVSSDIDATSLDWIAEAILATDHSVPRADWCSACSDSELVACVVSAADIIGQMSSREYLERLLFLYCEFREAGVEGFQDFHDLLEKTVVFYEATRKRLLGELNEVVAALELHFEAVIDERRNCYLELVDRNIAYLQSVLREDRDQRLAMLKRGGIVREAGSLI